MNDTARSPKWHGMMFCAEMVRAFLADRKSQTRWLVTPPRGKLIYDFTGEHGAVWVDGHADDVDGEYLHVPYCHPDDGWGLSTSTRIFSRIAVGDFIYVKETIDGLWGCDATYVADDERLVDAHPEKWNVWRDGRSLRCGTVSALFMPRWASRIAARVSSVRAQRLQEISEADAQAEGAVGFRGDREKGCKCDKCAYTDFAELWDVLHVKPGTRWADNPWVWAYTLEPQETADGVAQAN